MIAQAPAPPVDNNNPAASTKPEKKATKKPRTQPEEAGPSTSKVVKKPRAQNKTDGPSAGAGATLNGTAPAPASIKGKEPAAAAAAAAEDKIKKKKRKPSSGAEPSRARTKSARPTRGKTNSHLEPTKDILKIGVTHTDDDNPQPEATETEFILPEAPRDQQIAEINLILAHHRLGDMVRATVEGDNVDDDSHFSGLRQLRKDIEEFLGQRGIDVCCDTCKLQALETEELLECSSCWSGFHLKCLDPPLKSIPKEDWFCEHCIDVKRLKEADARAAQKKKEEEEEKDRKRRVTIKKNKTLETKVAGLEQQLKAEAAEHETEKERLLDEVEGLKKELEGLNVKLGQKRRKISTLEKQVKEVEEKGKSAAAAAAAAPEADVEKLNRVNQHTVTELQKQLDESKKKLKELQVEKKQQQETERVETEVKPEQQQQQNENNIVGLHEKIVSLEEENKGLKEQLAGMRACFGAGYARPQ